MSFNKPMNQTEFVDKVVFGAGFLPCYVYFRQSVASSADMGKRSGKFLMCVEKVNDINPARHYFCFRLR